MSIVPKEVVQQWRDEYGTRVMPFGSDQQSFAEYIASRASGYAIQQAAQLCDSHAHSIDHGGNPYIRYPDAAACARKLRALLKGGESDGQ